MATTLSNHHHDKQPLDILRFDFDFVQARSNKLLAEYQTEKVSPKHKASPEDLGKLNTQRGTNNIHPDKRQILNSNYYCLNSVRYQM